MKLEGQGLDPVPLCLPWSPDYILTYLVSWSSLGCRDRGISDT